MDGTRLVRFRWRLRGAWMWPSFAALTIVDGLLFHWLPPVGESASVIAGWLIGMFASLGAFLVIAPILAIPLRRVRTDMPRIVARDYAGAATTALITLAFLLTGLVHHATIAADRVAFNDAVARAQAYIGDHAPDRFRRHLSDLTVYPLQVPQVYRVCAIDPVATAQQSQNYCVVVHRSRPFSSSVSYSGSESNSLISQGTS